MVAEFLQEGFEIGSPGIVIATTSQREEIVRELTARSLDVAALQESGDLLLLDGAEVLSAFIVHGKPDAGRFREQICDLIGRVRRRRPDCRVRIFGQMVDVLWQQEDRDAAIRLELLWNQFAQAEASMVVCGYAIGNFYKDARFEQVYGRRSQFVSSADGQTIPTVSAAPDAHRRRSSAKRP